jgi:hypothetical protein
LTVTWVSPLREKLPMNCDMSGVTNVNADWLLTVRRSFVRQSATGTVFGVGSPWAIRSQVTVVVIALAGTPHE